jgi:hypothetical protein
MLQHLNSGGVVTGGGFQRVFAIIVGLVLQFARFRAK